MTPRDSEAAAAIAFSRFGTGAGPGEVAAIAGDPRGWLHNQIAGRRRTPSAIALMPPTLAAARLTYRAMTSRDREARDAQRKEVRALLFREAEARATAAVVARSPLIERLVWFWSNHFAVSALKPPVRALAGAFEREAIRPHVTGRFADLLRASTRHPAMLAYLDNIQSIGPTSRAGRRRGRGLNENLAREILELHTLGVDGGYSQADVGALAAMLTGWTVDRQVLQSSAPGRVFLFREAAHEPGPKTLLGQRYAEAGVAEAEAALSDLARHPATARHVATKLARHFISDDPPGDAIDRLAQVFLETDGDLALVTGALIDLDAPWEQPFAKVKTPFELVTSAARATGIAATADWLLPSLRHLGHVPFSPPSPKGWPDEADAWIGPEQLMRRIDWCARAARRLASDSDGAVVEAAIGPLARDETRIAIAEAADQTEALAIALASPEFQRR